MPCAPKRFQPARLPTPDRRPSASARGYDSKWRDVTATWIKTQLAGGNTRCAACGKLLTGDRRDIHVDHIREHAGQSDPLFWDVANWQMLHPACHSAKTAKTRHARGVGE